MKAATRKVATLNSKVIDEITRYTRRVDVTETQLNKVCKKYDVSPKWIATIMQLEF